MKLINSDCIKAMKKMPENSVDSIVTDPPYEFGFMGKSWDSSGIAFNVEVWREALRVLKPGGHLIAFSGSRTYHRMAVAIEDAGFEIRDQIMWVYGSGFPKSHNISKGIDKASGKLQNEWQGWGTALKPAHEPIVLARKPLIGTVANNVLTYGTGGLNIDGARVGSEEREYSSGNKLMEDRPWSSNQKEKPQYKVEGRFPANFIHDGSDEVVALFPDTKGVIRQPTGKGILNPETGWNANSMVDTTVRGFADSGSAARFFYCAKTSKRDRNEGLEGFEVKQTLGGGGGIGDYIDDVNSASGKYGSEKAPNRNHHPTVKPTDLMRYLCKLITPPNGIVLDPFMGSGSTGKGAKLEGFDFIGIDQSAEYVEIARARIAFVEKNNIKTSKKIIIRKKKNKTSKKIIIRKKKNKTSKKIIIRKKKTNE